LRLTDRTDQAFPRRIAELETVQQFPVSYLVSHLYASMHGGNRHVTLRLEFEECYGQILGRILVATGQISQTPGRGIGLNLHFDLWVRDTSE
jgi:hypothetical protein